jgi:hypothetical protein
VWESIVLAIDDQLNEIHVKKAQQAQGTPAGLSGVFYHHILDKISHHGLYMPQKQYNHFDMNNILRMEELVQFVLELLAHQWECLADI